MVFEIDSIYTNMINAIEYWHVKAMVSILFHIQGDGLFLKDGNDISDGDGLLMGNNSPFKNIPVLGWLL